MEPRDTFAAEVQRWLLVVSLVGSALVFGPRGGLDAGSITKATVVVLTAVVVATAALLGATRQRRLVVPWHPAVLLAGAFGVAWLARALLSDHVALALVGPIGRDNGAVLYLALVVLFAAAVVRADRRTWALVSYAWVATALLVALSAIDEATLRIGPDWAARPGVAGTLGNANFLAAWAALSIPVTLIVAIDPQRPRGWRLAAGATVPLLVIATVLSRSLQGGVVIVAAVTFFALVWARDRVAASRWRLMASGAVAAAVVGGAAIVLGGAGIGPAAFLRDQIGVRLRAEYWAAAARMFRDAPWTGVGPAKYLDHYRQHRSPGAAELVGLTSSSDSAHNVPLQFLAEGGLVVGSLYVAFLVSVGWALWRALATTEGRDRLRVGAIGAAWVGYVLQSLVSIDVPQLAVVGWILAGLIVGSTPAALRTFGAARPRKSRPQSFLDRPWQPVACVLVAVLAVAASWVVTVPYRADAASADDTVENRRTPERRSAETRATQLAPYQVAYRVQLAQALTDRGRTERAESVMVDALEENPDSFEAASNAARLAVANDDLQTAVTRYERVRVLEPHHPDLAVEMAKVVYQAGDEARARALLEEALAVAPDHEEALLLLEDL